MEESHYQWYSVQHPRTHHVVHHLMEPNQKEEVEKDPESHASLMMALSALPYPPPWYQFTAYSKVTIMSQYLPIKTILVADDSTKKKKTLNDNIGGLSSCYFTKYCIVMVGLSLSSVGLRGGNTLHRVGGQDLYPNWQRVPWDRRLSFLPYLTSAPTKISH